MSEHYAALGLKSDATLSDIKRAFRQKASQFHPDRNSDPDAPARFREVQEAYDILSDDDKRKACLLYTSPSPRDYAASRMPSSA